jgi:hypothetical protein
VQLDEVLTAIEEILRILDEFYTSGDHDKGF